ncbi:hypothetical protein BDF14DRAFT_1887320, partial [Spinellus fusiger]
MLQHTTHVDQFMKNLWIEVGTQQVPSGVSGSLGVSVGSGVSGFSGVSGAHGLHMGIPMFDSALVAGCIKLLPNRKAPGTDHLKAEMLKPL